MELTPKQRMFVEEYLVDMNATQAAVRAGYSPGAARQAYRLLKKPQVREAVDRALEKRAERTRVTQDRVVQEYARIAFMDPRRLFDREGRPLDVHLLADDEAAVLAGLEVVDLYEGRGANRELVGYTKKYKLADKLKALEALSKHLGLFEEESAGEEGELVVRTEMDRETEEYAG
ncbi:MAG: terminase small subunit [Oscillospiraceae bacterium]|nr:terminase small subunit [Oscillospiraceae bacterium]